MNGAVRTREHVDVQATSTAVLRAALTAYDRHLGRVEETEPDDGVAEAHSSGRRSILNRAGAAPWAVDLGTAQHVRLLVVRADAAAGAAVMDAIELFPRQLLALVERRRGEPAPRSPKRRAFEKPRPSIVFTPAISRLVHRPPASGPSAES